MSNTRRWYVYLVSAISLQAVAWAIIVLLRTVLIPPLDAPAASTAFQIAVIVIGLPVFLAHWLWGQRLAAGTEEERGATLRRFYLYGAMAGFLGPFLANAFDFVGSLLRASSTIDRRPDGLSAGSAVVYHLLALLVLGVLWFYHWRTAARDSTTVPDKGGSATVRRLYVLGFSAAGLTLTTLAVIHLLRWLMLQIGQDVVHGRSLDVGLTTEITRLVVGVPCWLVFWRWAQRLFGGPSQEERRSTLRKFYLYGAVLVGVLGAVANATQILASAIRAALGLPSQGDIRAPLPIIVAMAVLWAYHASVVRDDAREARDAPRQARVRRLYLYLVAAVGLAALLGGLGGDVSVIIRSFDEGFGAGLKEQLSWFTAAIVAGLPVWILPWRQLEAEGARQDQAGTDARGSVIRKIYLYVFLFIATMTALSGAVFVVFKFVGWILGSDAPTLNELAHAVAFTLIAVGTWLYHGSVLRSDHRLASREQIRRLESLRVVVVDVGDGSFGRAVVERSRQQTPELELKLVTLARPGGGGEEQADAAARLAGADLIVGPWEIAVPGAGEGAVSPQISRTVADSSARKLLVPTRLEGWEWAGVDPWDTRTLVRHTVGAIVQLAAGEEVKPARPMGAGTIISIIVGVLILLGFLASLVGSLLSL